VNDAVQHDASREGLQPEAPDSVNAGTSVAQLIKYLQLFDPTWRVFVRGYEGGLQDPVIVTGQVGLDVYDSSVYGPHGYLSEGWHEPTEIVNALVIDRDGR
jgi:hypothetical protein